MALCCGCMPLVRLLILLALSAVVGASDRLQVVAAEQMSCERYMCQRHTCKSLNFKILNEAFCDIRPEHLKHAKMARYVVHLNSWGSVASSSIHLGGMPFG